MNPASLKNRTRPYHLRIGSWSARADMPPADAALLNEIFKGAVMTSANLTTPADAEVHWVTPSTARERASELSPDALVVTKIAADVWNIETDALTLRIESGTPLPQIFVFNHPHTLEDTARRVHVSVVFHKLLLLLGRVYLHGGAVRVHDAASAFIAEKWSGKSSICLWLGRAGATILADDHIVIRQEKDSWQVSGCEQVARVTAVTEETLFATPLSVKARDFAGVMKKEFRVSEVFSAQPYTDVPLRRIFFPNIGTNWQIKPLSKQATLARLLAGTRGSHRFTDAADYARHLEYFSDLVRAVEAFDLELTPDLKQLDRLVEFLDL